MAERSKAGSESGALSAACIALAMRALQTVTFEIDEGFADDEKRDAWLARTQRCNLVDLRCGWLLEDAIVDGLDDVPALVALVRALVPMASRATPALGHALDVSEAMLTGRITFEQFQARAAAVPGGPSPADRVLSRVEAALSHGLNRYHSDLYPELVRDVAEGLESAGLLHELESVPEALALEIERVRGESFAVCEDPTGLSGSCGNPRLSCACGPHARAEHRFMLATNGREEERRMLRELAADALRSSKECRLCEPIDNSDFVEMLRALPSDLVHDDNALARTARVHALDIAANCVTAQIEAEHGRGRAARAALVAGMVLAHFEPSTEARDLAERVALRTLDTLAGKVSREAVEFEHDIDGLTSGGVVHAMKSAWEYAVELDSAQGMGRWLVCFGTEDIPSDTRAHWAATVALDVLNDAASLEAPRTIGEDGDDALRRFLGVPTTHELFGYLGAAE